MVSLHAQLMIVAVLTSVACCLPGIFLVLRGIALMSDAISHAILPGIVILFLLVQSLDSWWLIIGAAAAGMLTVLLTEWVIQTHRLAKDAAIGLVFPAFFSIGVILINRCARMVHLDTDMVLLGELAFTPFDRVIIGGIDLGPQAAWTMLMVCLINLLFVRLLYKELALSIFDPSLAALLGFSPAVIHYGLMTITNITAVSSFNVVGSIVVVALMLTPAATAYILTNTLSSLIGVALAAAAGSALGGCLCAQLLDVSIAGSIAMMSGLLFVLALICGPKGVVYQRFYNLKQSREQSAAIICSYLHNLPEPTGQETIAQALGWQLPYTHRALTYAHAQGMITNHARGIMITPRGRARTHTYRQNLGNLLK